MLAAATMNTTINTVTTVTVTGNIVVIITITIISLLFFLSLSQPKKYHKTRKNAEQMTRETHAAVDEIIPIGVSLGSHDSLSTKRSYRRAALC